MIQENDANVLELYDKIKAFVRKICGVLAFPILDILFFSQLHASWFFCYFFTISGQTQLLNILNRLETNFKQWFTSDFSCYAWLKKKAG